MNPQNTPERFWERVKKTDGCWEWQGGSLSNGYGCVMYQGKVRRTHRLAYILTYGEIDPQLLVCHTCDNRKCCRPDHLFLGTHQDNYDDMIAKGRHKSSPGVKNHNAKLNDDKVRIARQLYRNGHQQTAIARLFGVDKTTIHDVVHNRIWAHVKD